MIASRRPSSCAVMLSALLLAMSLAGCPRKGPGVMPASAFDARKLVPADSLAVISVDVPTILARPGIASDPALVSELSEKVKRMLGVDPALMRDTLIFVAPVVGERIPGRGAAIIPQRLHDAPGLGALSGATLHAGQPIYRVGTRASLTFLDGATVVGDAQSVRRIVDASRGQGASLPVDDKLYAVLDGLSPAPFRFAVPAKAMASLLSGLGIAGLDKIHTAGGSADFTDKDLVVKGLALTSAPEALATTLKNLVREFAGKLAQSTLFKVFGDILAGVEVVAGADRVSVGLKVPLELVRGVLPMVLSSLGL